MPAVDTLEVIFTLTEDNLLVSSVVIPVTIPLRYPVNAAVVPIPGKAWFSAFVTP